MDSLELDFVFAFFPFSQFAFNGGDDSYFLGALNFDDDDCQWSNLYIF